MALFSKKGQEPISLVQRYTDDIARKTQEIEDIERGVAAKQKRINDLALPAEEGDASALAEIDQLYDEIEHAQKILPRKAIARQHLEGLLSEEIDKKQAQENRLLQNKMLDLLRKRETYAKEAERHARGFVRNIAAIYEIDDEARGKWKSTWGYGSAALIGPDSTYEQETKARLSARLVSGYVQYSPKRGLAEFVRQMLGHLCKDYRVRLPAPAYKGELNEDFPGLTASYAAINDRVKKLFAEQPLHLSGSVEQPVEQPLPADVATAPTPAPPVAEQQQQPIMILSGAAWRDLQASTARRQENIAQDVNFNPFDPSQI